MRRMNNAAATGETAPLRMLVAVRARAAVAQLPRISSWPR